MPIEVDWYRPIRAIDERVWGMVTGDDARKHIDLLSSMLNQAQVNAPGRPVYLLYDDTEVEMMPPICLMLRQGLPVLRFKNRGPVFYVTHRKAVSSIPHGSVSGAGKGAGRRRSALCRVGTRSTQYAA